jgi:hypothetical protein
VGILYSSIYSDNEVMYMAMAEFHQLLDSSLERLGKFITFSVKRT